MAPLPNVKPMPLTRFPAPFSDPDFLFEVKYDVWRSLCYVSKESVKLVSRKGHVYKSFSTLCDSIAADLRVQNAILDGEIVCVDEHGHSQFNKLMYRRGDPYFFAFDLLFLNGEDLRVLQLIERKKELRKIIPARGSHLLFVDHIEARGEDLFRLACQRDLEGVVAKWKRGAYVQGERTSWVKVKNPRYTQVVGRERLFEKRK